MVWWKQFFVAIVILAVFGFALGAALSCGDDDDDNDVADDDAVDDDTADDDQADDDTAGPSVIDVGNSDCKDGSGPEAKDDWPQDITFDYEDGILTVTHVNGYFNCCLDSIDVTMSITGPVIDLYEVEVTPNPCFCECPFDVVTEIAGLAPGSYTVNIYADGAFAISGEVEIPNEG
jgi:hypothetical protein